MDVVGDCSWRCIYIASVHWGHGCWLLVGVERWLLQGGIIYQLGTFGLVAPVRVVAFRSC